jgi:hypothetical protein
MILRSIEYTLLQFFTFFPYDVSLVPHILVADAQRIPLPQSESKPVKSRKGNDQFSMMIQLLGYPERQYLGKLFNYCY